MANGRRFYIFCVCAQAACLLALLLINVEIKTKIQSLTALVLPDDWSNKAIRKWLPSAWERNPWTAMDKPPLFYHSALWDGRNGRPRIRILGIKLADTACSLECLGLSLNNSLRRVAAQCDLIKHGRQTPFREIYFNCDFGTDKPVSVSLVKKGAPFDTSARQLQVQYPLETVGNPSNLTVCVPPLYKWTDPKSLSMFFDYYTFYGADTFYLFNYSWNLATDDVIRNSNFNFSLFVIPWPNVPPISNVTMDRYNPNSWYKGQYIHSHAHIVAINYCLLHSYHRNASFALMIDIDEFLWLRDYTGRGGIIEYLRKVDNKKLGGLLFRSSPLQLSISNSTATALRSSQVFPAGTRSKMLVKPWAVIKEWIHTTNEFVRGYGRKAVQLQDGLVMHVHYDGFAKFGRHAMHNTKGQNGMTGQKTVNESQFAETMARFVNKAKVL